MDDLAKRGVLDAKGNAFAHQSGGVKRFFYLGRADAVARGLDHFVTPSDKVDEAFFVLADGVARKYGDFCEGQSRFPARQGFEAFGGFLRVVPVTLGDERAAMYQFAGFVGRAAGAVFAQDKYFCIGDGLADGVRSPVDFFGGQVGGAESFGEAVHEEGFGFREPGAQCAQRFGRHAPAGAGEVAQVFVDLRRPALLGQLDVQRRYGSQAGNFLFCHGGEHVAREQVVEQDNPGAAQKGCGQLAEAGVKRER